MGKNILLRRLLFVIVVLYWYSLYVHVPVQTSYLYGMNAKALLIGVIIGSYGFGQCVFRIPLGIRCDLTSKIFPYLFIGTIIAPISALFRLFFQAPWAFLVANILGGIAAAVWIALLLFFGKLFPTDQLHHAMAYATTGHSTAMLTSTLSCALLVGKFGMNGIAIAEIIAGLLSVAITLWAFIVYKEASKNKITDSATAEQAVVQMQSRSNDGEKLTLASLMRVVKNKRLWKFSLLAFVHQGLIMSLVMSFAANQAINIGATEQQVAISTFLYWIITVLVNILAGKSFMIKMGAKFWLPFALILASLYSLLLIHINSIAQLYILQMMGGIFGGTVLPFSMSEAMIEIDHNKRGTGIGVYQAILAGGMMILPPVAGALIQSIGMTGGFYFLSVVTLLAAGYAYLITKKRASN